jgi:uncharacterized membrane protein SpoIIM required for sporulation
MNIETFIADRSDRWNELDRLLNDVEQMGEERLGRKRLEELLTLYRESCSDLNKARSHTANPELLDRLNQLTGRAYRFLYRGGVSGGNASFRDLLLRDIPATFRRERSAVAAAALAMMLGALVGLLAVLWKPTNGERLIPGEFFTESPRERVERIESGDERIDTMEKAATFGAQLYTHNIQVSLLAFSLGALTIVGAYVLLFYNGVILGAVAAMYYLDGVEMFFFAWVGPHGALELPAIVFGAAAGIRFGRAFLAPGDQSRASAVRAAFPAVWRMLIATALTLVCAGLIEGSFSQFSGRSFPYALKISVAVILFISLMFYLFAPRDPGAAPARER